MLKKALLGSALAAGIGLGIVFLPSLMGGKRRR